MRILFLSVLSLALVACGKTESSGSTVGGGNQPVIGGDTFKGECNGKGTISSYTVNASQIAFRQTGYSKDNCSGNIVFQYSEINDYSVVGRDPANNEILEIDAVRRGSFLQFEDDVTTDLANQQSYCESSGWLKGVAQNVTGKSCTDNVHAGQVVHTLLFIQGNELRVGVESSDENGERDGSSPAKRHYYYSKKPFVR